MKYRQWTSTSMVGLGAPDQVNVEHHPFVKDRSNRRVPSVLDGGMPGKILLPLSSHPQVFSFLLPLLVVTTLQSGPEETGPDVKPLLHREIKKHPSQSTYSGNSWECLSTCIWTSISMMGWEAPVHVDAEHYPFAKDRPNCLSLLPCRQPSGRVPVSFTFPGAFLLRRASHS